MGFFQGVERNGEGGAFLDVLCRAQRKCSKGIGPSRGSK